MLGSSAVKCFITTAQCRSFTRAAEELFMSRQAVSKQIKRLEAELGTELFLRCPTSVALTPTGELYLDYFRRCADEWQALEQRVSQLTRRRPVLNIGYPSGINVNSLISDIARSCRLFDPDMKLYLERREPDYLVDALRDGAMDFVVSYSVPARADARDAELPPASSVIPDAAEDSGIDSTLVYRSMMLLAVNESNPRCVPGAVAADFLGEEFVTWRHDAERYDEASRHFIQSAGNWGLPVSSVQVLPNLESVQSAVELGMGVTVCSDVNLMFKRPGIKAYPLGKYTDISCAWRAGDKSPIVRMLAQKAKNGDFAYDERPIWKE